MTIKLSWHCPFAIIKSQRHQLNPTRNYWERRELNPGQLGQEASVLTVVLCRPPKSMDVCVWCSANCVALFGPRISVFAYWHWEHFKIITVLSFRISMRYRMWYLSEGYYLQLKSDGSTDKFSLANRSLRSAGVGTEVAFVLIAQPL